MDNTLRIFLSLVYEKSVYSYDFKFEDLDILLVQRFKRYFFSHRKSERRKLRDFSRNVNDVNRDIFYATAIKQIKKLIPLKNEQENTIKRYLGNLIFIMAEFDDTTDIEQIEKAIIAKFPEITRVSEEAPKIENYTILEEFNRTDYMRVYKAIDINKRLCFISTMKIDEEFDYSDKFKPLEFIFSPYLLKYKGCGITDKDGQKYFWFISEYDNCCTLRDIIETRIASRKKIDDNRLMIFSQGMLRGLNEIHKNGYYHGNLNPNNIYVNHINYDIRMKNYAIETVVNDHVKRSSEYPNYLAPEQMDGNEQTSTSSDIFSFAVILYEMFTNEYPFIMGKKTRSKDLYKDGVPFELYTFFKTSLSNDPEERFQKASEASMAFKEPANKYLKRIRQEEDMPKILEIFQNQLLQKYAIHHRGDITQQQISEFIDYCVSSNISAVSEERLREILPGIFSKMDSLDELERELEFEKNVQKLRAVTFDEEKLSKRTQRIEKLAPDDARRKRITDKFKKLLEEDIEAYLNDESDFNIKKKNPKESDKSTTENSAEESEKEN